MQFINLKPLDIIVVDGLWYMPHHWLIQWRSLDPGVHCLTVIDDKGTLASPEFTGIILRNTSHYKGRNVTIHRLRGIIPEEYSKITSWIAKTLASADGYDFRQWVIGGVLGICRKSWADSSKQWTCAELPYWMFQEGGGVKITPKDEIIPLPRMFRFNPLFDTIYSGVIE